MEEACTGPLSLGQGQHMAMETAVSFHALTYTLSSAPGIAHRIIVSALATLAG